MKVRINHAVKLLALVAAMAVASSASAQSAGQWMVEAGVNKITPKVDSGDLSAPALPHTKAAVGTSTKPVLFVTYGLTDNISAHLGLGLPYKHTLYGDGAIAGTGKLGTSEVLPPTLFAQYRFFDPKAMVRPYVGLGATYAYFQKETGSGELTALTDPGGKPTTFKIDNKLAASFQLGTAVAINDRWFADVTVVKTLLKTRAKYSTGQSQDIKFDPVATSLTIGYKF